MCIYIHRYIHTYIHGLNHDSDRIRGRIRSPALPLSSPLFSDPWMMILRASKMARKCPRNGGFVAIIIEAKRMFHGTEDYQD